MSWLAGVSIWWWLLPPLAALVIIWRSSSSRRAFSHTDQAAVPAHHLGDGPPLQHPANRFRELVETIPVCFWVTDPSGNVEYVSPAFELLHGRSPDTLLTHGLDRYADDVHPADADRFRSNLAAHLQTGAGLQEFRYIRPDGQIIWLRDSAFAVLDPQGRFVRFVGYTEEITQRKIAEQALATAATEARKLALVARGTDNSVVITDADGRIEWVNDAFTQMTGYALEEVLGKKPGSFLQGPGTDPVACDFMRQAIRRSEPVHVRLLNYHKSGQPYWIECDIEPVFDEQDRLVQFIAIQRDVTAREQAERQLHERTAQLQAETSERRRAEEAARQSEARFRALVEHAFDAVTCYDRDGRIVYVSPSNVRMDGRSPEETLGVSGLDFLHPEDRDLVRACFADLLTQPGKRLSLQARFIHKNGSCRWAEGTAQNLLDNPSVAAIVLNWRDVTERKEAEEATRRAREEADRASRAKSEFLSRMSHELRTPLNSILGFGQLLTGSELDTDQREAADLILAAGRHLLRLINDILDVSRIEAGRVSLRIEAVEVDSSMAQAADLIGPAADDHQVTLHVEAAGPRACVVADQQRLTQSLLNLLSNAVKYNRPGGDVWFRCRPSGSCWRFEVQDTGPGIPPDKLPRLFLPFERLVEHDSPVEGTGLGLAVARALVEAMGGRLDVDTQPEHGSTFWIELPASTQPVRLTPPSAQGVLVANITGNVLLVEDQPANRTLLEQAFRLRPGISLHSAPNGCTAIELARQLRFDLVLLDVHLGDLDGETVLRELRTLPTAPGAVLVLSADATQTTIDRLRAAGADAYLTKPLDVARLLRTIDQHLPRPT